MIKIFNIEPCELNSKYKRLEDLEEDHLATFRVNTQPEMLLDLFLQNGYHNDCVVTTITEIEILEYLHDNFARIIKGRPEILNSVINLFNANGWSQYINSNNKITKFGSSLLDIFGYDDRFRGNIGRGKWLANQLNIKSCPYCNAQYTVVVEDENNKDILKFQFDHFFPKSVYPYLSISLYNLIPTCASCNITKSAKPLSLRQYYHPYFMNLSTLAKFRLKYEPDPSKLTLNTVKKQDLSIEFVPRFPDKEDVVGKHDRMYHITGIYNRHQDIAEELLITAIIYTQGLAKSQMEIKGLFPDLDTYHRYLLRNYYLQRDTLKRPLAKFTQDIAKQLELI